MKDGKQDDQLYYIKFTKGHLVYIKKNGRRYKTTFSKFYDSYDPKADFNLHDLVELLPIDPKYEAAMDKKELELAIYKENNVDPYQMELF
ncbi:hypothetical protein [Enterococcus sp. AZ072]|uniref:hypothetical protein n=1 Tax=unclassified Enterococcus TaxID=2608891 RepID=UPI003D2DCD0F